VYFVPLVACLSVRPYYAGYSRLDFNTCEVHAWSCTTALLFVFMEWCFFKHRDNLIFYIRGSFCDSSRNGEH
jgi:hypothetical protein